jgi:hypothetical protein
VTRVEVGEREAFAFGAGAFAELQTVLDYWDRCFMPWLRARQDKSPAWGVVEGNALRARGWLGSLAKLDEPSDLQAVSAGCRALYELAIDTELLLADRTAWQQVLDWEEIARAKVLRSVRQHIATLENAGHRAEADRLSNDHSIGLAEFERLDKLARQLAESRACWQGGRRVNRWTGRDLPGDASEADKHASRGFATFYAEHGQILNLNTHGSGGAYLRRMSADVIPAVGARAMHWACDMAQVIAGGVLEYAGALDEARKAQLAELAHNRTVAFGATMMETREPGSVKRALEDLAAKAKITDPADSA